MCVSAARKYFEQLFNKKILKLVHCFPIDTKEEKTGLPFWSGVKRYPTEQVFDATDPLHVQFVTAAANLIAFSLGVSQNKDSAGIASIAKSTIVPTFIPKNKFFKGTLPGEESKVQERVQASPEDEEILKNLLLQIDA